MSKTIRLHFSDNFYVIIINNYLVNNEKQPLGFIGGFCDVKLNIRRETRDKWHVPYYVYYEEKYPKYCSTGAYAYFGKNAWKLIYNSVFETKFFQSSNMRHLPEDVLFTGIFANYTNIPRIHIPGFSFYDFPELVCINNKTIFYSVHLHAIKYSLDEAENIIWQTERFLNFVNHKCTARIN